MDPLTPQQTIELIAHEGVTKSQKPLPKLFLNAFMAGPLIGFGCAFQLSTQTAPWYQEHAPGLISTFGALMFPIGLILVVLTGADLFTSNIMVMSTSLLTRRIAFPQLLRSWLLSFIGNLAGMMFFTLLIIGYGGTFSKPHFVHQSIEFAVSKAVEPAWHQIFLRAIGANWLVCLAVFLGNGAREVSSKILAVWFPTATFVALELDHVVADMFFIPIGIWNGAPFGVGYYIWKSLIPTILGNVIGGGVFVAGVYWYLFLEGEGEVELPASDGELRI